MQSMHSLIVLDAALAVIMIVLASLSRRLGAALKIRPYYRLFYVAVGMALGASLLSAVSQELSLSARMVVVILPNTLRLGAGVLGITASLRYWKWLFTEYFER
jgi:hypothetical protein